ncbi:DUF2255 family protein [Streptomyces niveus]|uniref:DUF2255 family protein n=1 Tax=Streptomyces niveus TaxID=193462 RepID=UPI0036DF626E
MPPVATHTPGGPPTTLGGVRGGDHLVVRPPRGVGGPWTRPPTARHSGHISSGGVDKDVMFVEEDSPALNDRIDAAYRTKYARFGPSYVDPMVADGARAATLKLVPR